MGPFDETKTKKTKAKTKTETNHGFHAVQQAKVKKSREIVADFERFFRICIFTM